MTATASTIQLSIRGLHVKARHLYLAGAVSLVGALSMAGRNSPTVDVIKRAAGIGEDPPEGIERFVNGMDRLTGPAVWLAAGIVPLGVIAGGMLLMIGNRKAASILGGVVAGFLLACCAKGLAQ